MRNDLALRLASYTSERPEHGKSKILITHYEHMRKRMSSYAVHWSARRRNDTVL